MLQRVYKCSKWGLDTHTTHTQTHTHTVPFYPAYRNGRVTNYFFSTCDGVLGAECLVRVRAIHYPQHHHKFHLSAAVRIRHAVC